MKRISSTIAAPLGARHSSDRASGPESGVRPARPGASAAKPRVGAAVQSLQRARYASQQKKAEMLEDWTREILGAENAAQLAFAFLSRETNPDDETENRWIFVMINPAQNFAVLEWLENNSKRPQAAMKIWGLILTALRMDTGEVLLTREQIANRIGIEPDNVSRIMTELAQINAIRREKAGRSVRFFLNPNIATHIPGPEARQRAREGAGPLLTLMEGGRAST